LSILEKVVKILDYFSWEKIARGILLLFDNLKEVSGCQDHFSDIDALGQVTKLMNRHWIDKDITNKLNSLYTYFDENQ